MGCKLPDQPTEPPRVLHKQAPVLFKVIASLRKQDRKISRRGSELLLLILEIRRDVGGIRKNKIEFSIDVREHVAGRDNHVLPSEPPTLFLGILDCGWADVYRYNFPRHAGSKQSGHAASASQVEHPVARVAIFNARLLVFKRLVDSGENDESFLAQRDGRPQQVQLPNMPIPVAHESALKKNPKLHHTLHQIS